MTASNRYPTAALRASDSRHYMHPFTDYKALAEEGTISKSDLDLFQWCETAEDAWACICDFYELSRD